MVAPITNLRTWRLVACALLGIMIFQYRGLARPLPTEQELYDAADLVVLARYKPDEEQLHTKTEVTMRGDFSISVATGKFLVVLMLKADEGERGLREIDFRYLYGAVVKEGLVSDVAISPVRFRRGDECLLFLRRISTGRYEPVVDIMFSGESVRLLRPR